MPMIYPPIVQIIVQIYSQLSNIFFSLPYFIVQVNFHYFIEVKKVSSYLHNTFYVDAEM